MAHNESVETFEDVTRLFELEKEHLEVAKPSSADAFESNFCRISRFKRNRTVGTNINRGPVPKKAKNTKRKRSKRGNKTDKSKIACYNCNQFGHFAQITLSRRRYPFILILASFFR